MKKDKLVTVHVFDVNGNIIKVRFPLDKKTYEIFKTQDEDHQLLYFSLYYRDYKKEQRYWRRVGHYIEDVDDNDDGSFLIPDASLRPNEYVTALEKSEIIQASISKLSKKQRRVVIGIYSSGKNTVQLAKELGVSKAAIGQMRRRSLTKLKELLGDDFLEKF